MTKIRFVLLFGLIVLFFAVPCAAAADLEKVGDLMNGPSFDLIESGGYLYVAQGSEVRVYDVSSAAKMSALDWKDSIASIPVGSAVYGLEIKSGYLYIASATRFVIADLKNPGHPVIAGTLSNPYSGSEIRDVVLNGNTAYLTVVNGGIWVVDVTSKSAPRSVTKITLPGSNQPWRATFSGSRIYVGTAYDNKMVILDASTPTKPVIVGSYSAGSGSSDSVSGVAVKDTYAYIAEYHNGVRVIDVSNPAQPVEVTQLMGINANDIKILGNYAYVSVRYQGFDIIDISNPKSIKIIGQATDVPCYEEGIYPTAGYTFVSLESVGFGIYNTAKVTAPIKLAEVHVVGGTDSMAVQDNYLYIGAHNEEVWVVDVSDPSRPKEVAALNNGGRNTAVQIQGNYLYVAGEWSGIYVADVSNPQSPRWIVQHFDSNVHTVLPDGNYAYTEKGIVDFTKITSPAYVAKSSYFNGELAKFGDNYLLVASSEGVHILDVSNKKSPVKVATFGSGTSYGDVCVSGTTAVALTGNSVVTIDLSNPAAPRELGRVSYPGTWAGYSVVADGTYVYAVGTGTGHVRAFDISNPAKIVLLDSFTTAGYDAVTSVVQSDGYVFAGEKMGVHIFSTSLQPTNHAPVLATIGAKSVPVNTRLTFNITAIDSDGDSLTYAATAIPGNATFNTNTRTFSWVPQSTQAGSHTVKFTASDGKLTDYENVTITVTGANQPPVMAAIPTTTVKPGSPMSFIVSATDADGDKLTYSASGIPANATFNPGTRTFSWVPRTDQVGKYSVKFTASDGSLSDSKNATINVTGANQAPVMAVIPATTVKPGSPMSFIVSATDADGDKLTYSASGLPANSSFNISTRKFSWVPRTDQVGKYSVKFTASDGSLSDSKNATINITGANQPPVMAVIPATTVKPGATASFIVSATDADGDKLTYSASGLPENATFNPGTRKFSWVPKSTQTGAYTVKFTASDGTLTDSENAAITVTGSNQAPVLAAIPAINAQQGTRVTFTVTATDADRDRLTYHASNLPAGAIFNSRYRTFIWTPKSYQTGTYTVVFTVSDGKLTDTEKATITVTKVNHAPVMKTISPVHARQGVKFSIVVTAMDYDRDRLTYTASNLPQGAAFDSRTQVFTWTPGAGQTGIYSVAFTASDGKLSDTEMVKIQVYEVKPPTTQTPGTNPKKGSGRYYIKLE